MTEPNTDHSQVSILVLKLADPCSALLLAIWIILGQMFAWPGHGHAVSVPQAIDPSAPPVQMLIPGFEVRRLPVDLNNINNVRYRPDGKLLALSYSGDAYLLSDTNADRLEDRVELFWNNQGRLRGALGIALTPKGYSHGDGFFVVSKGKCSLIVDTNRDDRADREIIIAKGWKEISHPIDALGVAVAEDGSIYFGIGTANFVDPYQLDKEGKSHYQLTSERGTILKVSPDFKKREIVCTGLRFSVALAFNHHGDLFATDQEASIDLSYNLHGVRVVWQSQDRESVWKGWLPHLDLSVSRTLTEGSKEHARLWTLIKQPGRLLLQTQLNLWQMLRPALQVGSALDYPLSPEEVTLTFMASQSTSNLRWIPTR